MLHDLTKFDPTVEKLTELVAESAGIVTVDLQDATQLEVVKKARIKLRDARVLIEKTGKSYRDEATKYSREVIEKERSLIALIEPEEDRLKAFEEEAKAQKELAIRREQLPSRMERLTTLGLTMTEADVLALDSVEFETKVNQLVAAKNEADRKILEDQKKEAQRETTEGRTARLVALGLTHGPAGSMQFVIGRATLAVVTMADLTAPSEMFEAKIAELTPFVTEKKEKAEADAKKEKEEGEERARQQERQRLEREAKEKKEREEREERERKEKEAREKAEVEKKKAYKKFLTDNGWTPETAQDFKEEHLGEGVVVLWKKVSTFRAK